ncbi:MAG: ISAs1 family transposase [Dethiobacter sp.]|nr:ISAs1 family transposase [Dethiobacter sp.]
MSNGLYQGKFFDHFGGIKDTRQEGKVWHRLTDILFIVVCGIICGYDEWDLIHEWASAPMSQKWLNKYIALANGLPSLSTIKRGFGILDSNEFSTCFIEWMKDSLELPDKDVVSLDGKTLRGSKDSAKETKALHMVSALCHSHGLVIGQTKTDEKSNEITAIPELLDQLFIEGCIVTIDAMGLQKKIVKKIVHENKADYVINLKGNQETLRQEVEEYFKELEQTGELENIQRQSAHKNANIFGGNKGIQVHSTLDKGHGRIEKRTYFYATDLTWMVDAKRDWEKLTGIGMVVREVEYTANLDKKTKETAYYVGSVNNVTDFAKAARTHWGIESMHWSMDVVFGDDRNQTRAGVAAQNLATVKRMVFNTLKNETSIHPKKSKNKKRIVAATDTSYRDVLINLNLKER